MNSRLFWLIATVAFILMWFVFMPYLASLEGLVETRRVSVEDHFTDSRGLSHSVRQADGACMAAVYAGGSKVAAQHASAPLDTPDRIYMQCMFDRGAML